MNLGTSNVKLTSSPAVKAGVNTVNIEAVYGPLGKDENGTPYFHFKIADSNIKKILWFPKMAGNTQSRALPFSKEVTINGNVVKIQKDVVMTDDEANAVELDNFITDATRFIRSALGEGANLEGATSFEDFAKKTVALFKGKSYPVNVKLVYGKPDDKGNEYLEFATGVCVAPAGTDITIKPKDKLTKVNSSDDANIVSKPTETKVDDLPF